MAGVEVALLPLGAATRRTALTDSSGRFGLEVAPGGYRIALRHPGFYRPRDGGLAYVDLTNGFGAELRIELAPTLALAGRVLDAAGRPVRSASVRAYRTAYVDGRRRLSPCDVPTAAGPAPVSTDAEGRYRISGLLPGDYWLAASADGCNALPWFYPGTQDPAQAVQISVGGGANRDGVDLRFGEPNVYTATFEVREPDWDDAVSGDPVVQLLRRGGDGQAVSVAGRLGESALVSRTDGETFTIRGLPAGSYEVYYKPFSGDATRRAGSSGIGQVAIEVVDGDVDAGAMRFLERVPLDGRIRIAPGASVDSGFVAALRLRSMEDWHPLIGLMETLLTAPDGEGRFSTFGTGVSEGRYQVSVDLLPSGAYVDSVRYQGLEVPDSGFRVSPDGAAELDVLVDAPGGEVTGVVRDRDDTPGPSSRVVLVPAAGRRLSLYRDVLSDQWGRYRIEGIAPGEYDLFAWTDLPDGAWESERVMARFEALGVRVRFGKGDVEAADLQVITGGRIP
jgi:hypothetical protein